MSFLCTSCVPVLLGWYLGSVCKRTRASARDSTEGGWQGTHRKEAGEEISCPPPALFCDQRLWYLTKTQLNHPRLGQLLVIVACSVLRAKPKQGRDEGTMGNAVRERVRVHRGGVGSHSTEKGKPRCSKSFQCLILLCSSLHHQMQHFLLYLSPLPTSPQLTGLC